MSTDWDSVEYDLWRNCRRLFNNRDFPQVWDDLYVWVPFEQEVAGVGL
jgi:hypothetical protein